MGKTTSRRIIFSRKRLNIRKYLKIRNFFILAACIFVVLGVTSFVSMQLLKNKVSKSTIKFAAKEEKDITIEENSYIDVEKEKEENNDKKENEITEKTDDKVSDENTSLMVLGEIMMGGKVTQALDYNYMLAFKEVYNITKESDFTYSNLATNITNLDKIEDAKTDYLVTKNIVNAFNALGIDALSIATDHITDYPENIIKNTESILEKNNIFVAGKKDMPVYFEKNDKKIAIVSTNSVIIGTKNNYEKNGISTYSEENIKKNILEAKKMSDFVIVDIHWGKGESQFGITEEMKNMARFVIDCGADMVMGTHAVGIQPIDMYNGKPIIYSTGYFMTNLEYETTKLSYMFNFKFNKDTKLESIEMTPIYIKDLKETVLFNSFDSFNSNVNMNSLVNRSKEKGVNAEVKDGKIVVSF